MTCFDHFKLCVICDGRKLALQFFKWNDVCGREHMSSPSNGRLHTTKYFHLALMRHGAWIEVQTYLKHKPKKEHHSNTGNNICMILDDKLMAENWRVLAILLSDPHFTFLWLNLPQQKNNCKPVNTSPVFISSAHVRQITFQTTSSKARSPRWIDRLSLLLTP